MENKYKIGDIVYDKANPVIRVVILRVKMSFFGRPQKYSVRWHEEGEFHTGTALEHELATN